MVLGTARHSQSAWAHWMHGTTGSAACEGENVCDLCFGGHADRDLALLLLEPRDGSRLSQIEPAALYAI